MNLTARGICSGLFYALNRFCLFYTDNCVIMIDVTDVNFLKDNDIGMKKPENRKNANSKLTSFHIVFVFDNGIKRLHECCQPDIVYIAEAG